MSWLYNGRIFKDEDIPLGAIGFVYEMKVNIKGTIWIYIGKKNFHASIKKKLSKKKQSSDQRKKKYTRVSKSSYQNYYSSNDVLKQAYKDGISIHRTILRICYSKQELTYQEVKAQFHFEVLEYDNYLNGNILGHFYKQERGRYESK